MSSATAPTKDPYDDSSDREDSAGLAELDALVGDWLSVPEVAERLRVSPGHVRRLLQEGELLGIRRGEGRGLAVPARFLTDDGPLPALRGTLTVLADGHLTPEEQLRWLFTPDPTLHEGASPVAALESGRKTEIRRRAQELAF